jgi:aerobic carbon-monoxide dehydrogenase medium subunit
VPVRNRGTVGGSIAHADPAAELPAVVLALDAELVAIGPVGERCIAAADFFRGPYETALEPGEILTEVRVPIRGTGQAFVEFTRTHGTFAVVGVAASVGLDSGKVHAAAIALSGVAGTPVRATAAERALVGAGPDDAAVRAAANAAADRLDPTGDVHGSSETRVATARSCLRQAVTLALSRAQEGR